MSRERFAVRNGEGVRLLVWAACVGYLVLAAYAFAKGLEDLDRSQIDHQLPKELAKQASVWLFVGTGFQAVMLAAWGRAPRRLRTIARWGVAVVLTGIAYPVALLPEQKTPALYYLAALALVAAVDATLPDASPNREPPHVWRSSATIGLHPNSPSHGWSRRPMRFRIAGANVPALVHAFSIVVSGRSGSVTERSPVGAGHRTFTFRTGATLTLQPDPETPGDWKGELVGRFNRPTRRGLDAVVFGLAGPSWYMTARERW